MGRKRGDTRRIRHARTREDILAAARDVVLESGIEQFSLREVARRVDYSPAGLYEYFENREALLSELASLALGRLADALHGSDTVADPRERLVQVGLAYIDFGMNNSEDYLLLFSRMTSGRRSNDQEVTEDNPYSILYQAVGPCIGPEHREQAGPQHADTFAYGLWALAHGQVMLRLTNLRNFDADFDAAARLALEAYVDGLRS